MTKTETLKVPDMSCEHCEISVQEALDELDGVKSSKADHKSGAVEVTYEEDKLTKEQLGHAIEGIGYTLQA